MNKFKEKLKAEGHNEDVIKEYLNKEYEKYHDIYSKKDVQDYFHNVVAAIMLAQHNYYEDFTVEIPYRFKSPKSMKDKIKAYALDEPITYDVKTTEPKIHIKKISDVFAMKVIACNRPPTFYSNDPEIKRLVEEKKENHKLLGEMQEFKSKIIKDEFSNPKVYDYSNCTKVEYFENCKCLLERIKILIDPQATNLLKKYDEQITDIDNCLSFIKAANDEEKLIDEEDIKNERMNFFKVLDDFTARVHDKLDLAVLTKQFHSLFQNNEVFQQLGISFNGSQKEKRTKDGFVSNFIYVDTLFGPIECQLQSQHEYVEGNYGYAAHTKLKGKAIKPLPIPNLKDKQKINEFVQQIKEIAPKSFLARIDSTEKSRVITQQFSDYQNYKNITSQVAKGDPCENYILNYFSKLYVIQDKIFKSKEKSLGYVDYDIEEYLKSDSFQRLKKQVKSKEKTNEIFR